MILASSCAQQSTVLCSCIDGQVSEEKSICDRIAKVETERLTCFVCADGTTKENPEDCPPPAAETTLKTVYVCQDNSTTESRSDCKTEPNLKNRIPETVPANENKSYDPPPEPIVVIQSEGRQMMRDKSLKEVIYGEVLNNDTRRCMTKITARLYTAGMKFVGQESAIAIPFHLNPKQKGSFDIEWDPLDHQGYQKYEINAECSII